MSHKFSARAQAAYSAVHGDIGFGEDENYFSVVDACEGNVEIASSFFRACEGFLKAKVHYTVGSAIKFNIKCNPPTHLGCWCRVLGSGGECDPALLVSRCQQGVTLPGESDFDVCLLGWTVSEIYTPPRASDRK